MNVIMLSLNQPLFFTLNLLIDLSYYPKRNLFTFKNLTDYIFMTRSSFAEVADMKLVSKQNKQKTFPS